VSFGARALIRLGALEHNLDVIRAAAPGCRVMAVVKANAYGHGLVPVATHLKAADSFAVARIGEAERLRAAGIEQPIVLLEGVWTHEQLLVVERQAFEIVVHSPEQIDLLEAERTASFTVWLKFDTGMNRLGFALDDAAGLIARLSRCPSVGELRLMTHLSSADLLDNPATRFQLDRFQPIVEGFEGAISIANTPATLAWPESSADAAALGHHGDTWIRPGIALFGISPFRDQTGEELGLKPVMQLEARIIAVKHLAAGARVGYHGRYTSDVESTLGIIAAGYGDGYTRHFRTGTPVLVNGRRVPLIGNVSMDMIAVDLGPGASDRVGDVALLWGTELPVEEVAVWADTIPYELVCGVMNREASEVVD